MPKLNSPLLGTAITKRETDVIHHIVGGCTNAEVAHELDISTNTVKALVMRIKGRLGLRTRTQIAVWALTSSNGSVKKRR